MEEKVVSFFLNFYYDKNILCATLKVHSMTSKVIDLSNIRRLTAFRIPPVPLMNVQPLSELVKADQSNI